MIDRVFFGEVTDFIRTDFIDFPIFNGADSFVTVGCIMMLIYLLFVEMPAESKKAKALKKAKSTEQNLIENNQETDKEDE